MLDLAIDPGDPTQLLASGGAALYRSQDAGRTWHSVGSGVGGLLAWPGATRLFIATLDGALLGADGPSGPWRPRGDLRAPVAALLAVNERTLFAALHDGTIKQSGDGGATWKVRATP